MSERLGRASRAGAALFGTRLVAQVLGFVRAIVVARLLAPAEFGLFALLVAVLGGVQALSRPGLHQALMAMERRPKAAHLDAAWVLLFARGMVMSALLVAGSSLAATLLGQPRLADLLRVAAFSPLIAGLGSPATAMLQRDLRMGRLELLRLVAIAVDLTVSLVLAAFEGSAAAPTWGLVSSAVVMAVGSWVLAPYATTRRFDRRLALELLRFSRWRTADGFLAYLATQLDDLVLGRLSGVSALGGYRVAYRLANLPATDVVNIASTVALPAFVDLRRDGVDAVNAAFVRYFRLVTSLVGVFALLTVALAENLVLVLVGPQWLGAVVPLQVLAGAGFVRAAFGAAGPLLLSAQRPAWLTAIQGIRAVTLVATIWLVVPYGATGAAMASLLSVTAAVPVTLAALSKCDVVTARLPILAGRAVALALAPAGLAVGAAALGPSPALALLAGGVPAMALWMLLLRGVEPDVWQEVQALLRSLRSTPRRRGESESAA